MSIELSPVKFLPLDLCKPNEFYQRAESGLACSVVLNNCEKYVGTLN